MHLHILHLVTTLMVADATFVKEWDLQGCLSDGASSRCNSLSAGHRCDVGLERSSDGDSSTIGASEAGHLGCIDEEEAALPPVSYHKPDGEQISKEEFDKMSALEIAHEANGTLHLLYPDVYHPNYIDYYGLPTDNPTFAEDFEDVEALVCQQAVPR
jgi:hypothetical protein